MRLSLIVPVNDVSCKERLISRLIASVRIEFDEILFTWWGEHPPGAYAQGIARPLFVAAVPSRVHERDAIGDRLAEWIRHRRLAAAIQNAIEHAKGDWSFVLFPSEQLAPRESAAFKMARNFPVPGLLVPAPDTPAGSPTLHTALAAVDDGTSHAVNSAALTVIGVEDSAGEKALMSLPEIRGIRMGAAWAWGHAGFRDVASPEDSWTGVAPCMHLIQRPVLYQPISAEEFENGRDPEVAMDLAKEANGPIDKRIYVKARTRRDTARAAAAFWTLFDHCCRYEELKSARELLEVWTPPYTLEEVSPVDALKRPSFDVLRQARRVLDQQVGHLTAKGEASWYADGAISEVLNEDYVKTAALPGIGSIRAFWISNEANQRKLKRVVEFGALDGPNLFTCLQVAPSTEWHGVEVNPNSVAHAKKLATCIDGLSDRLHMHNAGFSDFARSVRSGKVSPFDAAFCFEVLEHNWEPDEILRAVEDSVASDGRIYLCTPCGAWSLHNPDTYTLECRKEHIRAWTGARMKRLLESRGGREIQVQEFENPSFQEANGWVLASYVRPEHVGQ